jgi:hypothetical protein
VAGADLAHGAQIAGGRDDHAGLALDRLDQEGDGVGRDRRRQRRGVAEGDDLEARRERAEAVTRDCGSVEKPTTVRVRPWKLSAQTMISAWPSGTPLTCSPICAPP